ncbi:hypothetical protein D3C87_1613140 [compost metagenome]
MMAATAMASNGIPSSIMSLHWAFSVGSLPIMAATFRPFPSGIKLSRSSMRSQAETAAVSPNLIIGVAGIGTETVEVSSMEATDAR